jgi:hypothetical protein
MVPQPRGRCTERRRGRPELTSRVRSRSRRVGDGERVSAGRSRFPPSVASAGHADTCSVSLATTELAIIGAMPRQRGRSKLTAEPYFRPQKWCVRNEVGRISGKWFTRSLAPLQPADRPSIRCLSPCSPNKLAKRTRLFHAGTGRFRVQLAPGAYCRLPVPWDHPRCQKHGTTSRPQPPAEVMISTPGRIVKCAVGAVSAEAQGVALPDRFSCRRRAAIGHSFS